jgi:hypothetical protein
MPKTVRCKFHCHSITRSLSSRFNSETQKYETAPLDTAKFGVVSSGSEENKEFFKSTPSGMLEVGCHDPDVFVVGKEYFVEITLAE